MPPTPRAGDWRTRGQSSDNWWCATSLTSALQLTLRIWFFKKSAPFSFTYSWHSEKCLFSEIVSQENARGKFLPRGHESLILMFVLKCPFPSPPPLLLPTGSFLCLVFSFEVSLADMAIFGYTVVKHVWRGFIPSYQHKVLSTWLGKNGDA